MTHRILVSMKREWTQLPEAGSLIANGLHLPQVRAFLVVYVLSFGLVLPAMGPVSLILAAAPTLALVLFTDVSVVNTGASPPKAKNGPLELLILVVVSITWMTLMVGLSYVIEIPPYAEIQVAAFLSYRVAAFLGNVFLVLSILRIQGYKKESAGLTSNSMTSAWLVTAVCTAPAAFLLPLRVIGLAEGLPIYVAVVGLLMSAVIELVFVAFSEELMFRGMIQDRFITVTRSSKTGIILTGLVFAFFHIPKHVFAEAPTLLSFLLALPLSIVLYAPGGIALGIIFHRTRSLKWSTAVHTVLNMRNIDPLGFLLAAVLL